MAVGRASLIEDRLVQGYRLDVKHSAIWQPLRPIFSSESKVIVRTVEPV